LLDGISLTTAEIAGEFEEQMAESNSPASSAPSVLSELSLDLASDILPLLYLDTIPGNDEQALMTVIQRSLGEMPTRTIVPVANRVGMVSRRASLTVSLAFSDIDDSITDAASLVEAIRSVSLTETPSGSPQPTQNKRDAVRPPPKSDQIKPVTPQPVHQNCGRIVEIADRGLVDEGSDDSSENDGTEIALEPLDKKFKKEADRRRIFICGKCQHMTRSRADAETHAHACLAPRTGNFDESDIRVVIFTNPPHVATCCHCRKFRQTRKEVIMSFHENICHTLNPDQLRAPFIPPGIEWEQYDGALHAPSYYIDLIAKFAITGDWPAIEHTYLANSQYWRWVRPYQVHVPVRECDKFPHHEMTTLPNAPLAVARHCTNDREGACGDGPAPSGPRHGRQARQRNARRRRHNESMLNQAVWPANIARIPPSPRSRNFMATAFNRVDDSRSEGMVWSIQHRMFIGHMVVAGTLRGGHGVCWPIMRPEIRNLTYYSRADRDPNVTTDHRGNGLLPRDHMGRATSVVMLIDTTSGLQVGTLIWKSDPRNMHERMITSEEDAYKVNPGQSSVNIQFTEISPAVSNSWRRATSQ